MPSSSAASFKARQPASKPRSSWSRSFPRARPRTDHGRKRWAYRTIPSLQHYVLIDQYEPVVEVCSRATDGSWRSVVHRGLEGHAQLPALGIEIGSDEVFARVTFAPAARTEA